MRIAMIGVRGIPSTSGGTEVAAEEISTRLIRSGYRVSIYCRKHYTKSQLQSYRGVRLIYVPSIDSKHFEAISHTFLSTVHALFSGYRIFHFHAIGPSIMAWLPRLFGKRVICTSHGLDYERAKWGFMAKIFLRLGEYVGNKCAHIQTAVSSQIAQYYQKAYGSDAVFIPNGVNAPQLNSNGNYLQQNGLCKDSYILFLSRIVPEKGLHYLIKAFSQIKTDKTLIIAGQHAHSPDYFKYVTELCQADSRIRFVGGVFGEEKAELFANAYCFILPSDVEGLPIALLEALSYGIIPIVSNIPVHQELISGRGQILGYTFQKGQIDSLRSTIESVLSHPEEREVMKPLLRDFVKTNFSWDHIVAKYSDCYHSIATNGHS